MRPTWPATRLQAAPAPRVIWLASVALDLQAPKGGINISRDFEEGFKDPAVGYAITKTANWYLAAELPRQPNCDKIISVAVNPGNLRTAAANI